VKVGILTWYDVLNYGSVFQAYALQEKINELGASAQILRHDRVMPDYYGNKLESKNLKGYLKWLRNQTPNRRKNRAETHKKHDSFVAFRNEYLNVTMHYSETDVDRAIIGSDQIFDINGMYFPVQFGTGIPCESISTYAPSFGETTLEKLRENTRCSEICHRIKELKTVNARDKNTQDILSEIRNEEIPIVLDPTLLYSFEKEKRNWNKRLISEKYCIIYTWGGSTTSAEFAEQCRRFAEENNLKLVSIGEPRSWCDIQYSSASPIEFFELFMHADMVLTNMFHGTCFSILMGRPFYSFVMPHNMNKLGDLLNFLHLDSQTVLDINKLSMKIPNINYVEVNEFISSEREKSENSLRMALGV
jgi:hypothetical protein